MTAEMMGCPQTVEGYDDFVRNTYAPMIAEMSEYFPVIVGEWCLFNSVGCGVDTHGGQSVLNGEEGAQAETLTAEQKRSLYQGVAESQLAAWSKGSGFYYWNYKLLTDTSGAASDGPHPEVAQPFAIAGHHGRHRRHRRRVA